MITSPSGSPGALTAVRVAAVQKRTVNALVVGQVLGGLGIGATLSIGAVLAAHVSGNDALSGTAATFSTLGAAAAAIPLARAAQRLVRRTALSIGTLTSTIGSLVIIASAAIGFFALLLLGFALLGVGSAVNLQSRFAATDLAEPTRRGRQLSLVVWSTTIGAVVGPNLSGVGEDIARVLGMPHLTGSFAIAIAAQLVAVVVYQVALRPDPYLLSRRVVASLPVSEVNVAAPMPVFEVDVAAPSSADTEPPTLHPASAAARTRLLIVFAIGAIAASHMVMVAVMSMTPLHLTHHGATIAAVGFTISVHVAGMYALSPVFGWLSDRAGRFATILIGQVLLAVGLVAVSTGEMSSTAVTVGLTFIGLGWSATTVSGSALVTDLAPGAERPRIQGRSDLTMNIAGAVGGATAGPILALVGYSGLAAFAGVLVVAVVAALIVVARRTRLPALDSTAVDPAAPDSAPRRSPSSRSPR